jgi:mono/diheme cytochrome c family protein
MAMIFRPSLKLVGFLHAVLAVLLHSDLSVAQAGNSSAATEFNRDILPIFATTCIQCHGPNEVRRMANLRLDTQDFLSEIVVAGDAEASTLYQRLTHVDSIQRMPPSSSGLTMTDEQIGRVRQWIDSGAEWGAELSDQESSAVQVVERSVDFNREVRPVLSRNCFACHGPNEGRQVGLRLDSLEGMVEAREGFGGPVIVPGNAEESLLFQRISTQDEALRMPYGRGELSRDEIETIRLWIDQGANWENYWAFVAPVQPDLPSVTDSEWSHNPIDNFVLTRLEQEGLNPSSETDRATLIRRVSLDLTGMPPSLEEVDAFLNDSSPDAYETVVERLLQSPRYGERMAVAWLDAARYADTNGYQTDGERSMWRWRDWVINAYNDNMPFDQFTIEQLAGDMLPNATLEQRIATAFNRNHSLNAEGGIDPDEFLIEYAVDRVATTSAIWMGLTLGCARCHDHKFDPIRQTEFYEATALFNNIPERGKGFKYVNAPPLITAPTTSQQAEIGEIDQQLDAARQVFADLEQQIAAAQQIWEESLGATTDIDADVDWNISDQLLVHHALDGDIAGVHAGQVVNGTLENGLPHFVNGRLGSAASFDGERFISAGSSPNLDYVDEFSLAAWIYPTADNGVIFSRAREGDQGEVGWGLYIEEGKVRLSLATRVLDDGVAAETVNSLQLNRWQHVLATYDGTMTTGGMKIYIDGNPLQLNPLLDLVGNRLPQREPFRIGASGSSKAKFQGHIDDVRIYGKVLTPAEAAVLATTETISEIAALAAEQRTTAQADKLRLSFLNQYAPPDIGQAFNQLQTLQRQRKELWDSYPTVMVMEEMQPRRETFRLNRGAYDNPAEPVFPDVPSVLPPLPEGQEKNRLTFARWLVDPVNPLTARVTVNRYWQMYFGTGLVKSTDNFGSQGEFPSHPELLDWLATNFIASGWDVKEMQRLIVTSATYRQSSSVSPQLLERDPENRLLARATRVRLSAQVIRDQALAISGLLTERIGGPSVGPYQPDGLWDDIVERGQEYRLSQGEDLYRRSLYSFWKRTRPPPAMITFDSSTREVHSLLVSRTNTPLQALNLMNDVTYAEAARAIAQNTMLAGLNVEQTVSTMYRMATAREPESAVRSVLVEAFNGHFERYKSDRAGALQLVSAGESARDQTLDITELAAYQMVASMILNLDGTITKD